MKTVLAIDGGGIRGIIPALILDEIEVRTGKKISELFDIIAGTSTGGLLALGLVKPDSTGHPEYTARNLVELYENERHKIFCRQFVPFGFPGLFEERYSSKGIEDVLDRYFGDARLSHSLSNVIITSYEIEKRTPWFFKHFENNNATLTRGYGDIFMKDIARATSAAPTYFEPKQIDHTRDVLALVDGGIFANNPAMCAYVEARKMYPDTEELVVVSLGTGEQTESIRYEDAKGWGVIEWAPALLDIVFDGVSKTVDYQLKQLLPLQEGIERYYRFQAPLAVPDDALDNISEINIDDLKNMASQMISNNSSRIANLCNLLMSR